MSWTNKELKQT